MKPLVRKMLVRILVLLGVVSLFVGFFRLQEHMAERTICDAIPLIDSYREHHGRFPSSLSLISESSRLRWRILLAPRVDYLADATHYRLTYYHSPLGPFHYYDSSIRTWGYEE